MEWILFYYNSLPDLPPACPFFSKHIMHRDFLKCNPKNTGHYKYPKFESLSYDTGCHEREVENFLKRTSEDKYVMFYTRHTYNSGKSENKIAGYFKVGTHTKNPFGFIASETVLLPKEYAIPIRYKGRGVPTSWGHSRIKNYVDEILEELKSSVKQNQDISVQYKKETRKAMKILSSKSGRDEMLVTCNDCKHRMECFWGRKPLNARKKILSELYSEKKAC